MLICSSRSTAAGRGLVYNSSVHVVVNGGGGGREEEDHFKLQWVSLPMQLYPATLASPPQTL